MKKRQRSPSPIPRPTLIYHKPLGMMTPDELRVWFQGTHERLTRKMQRERTYLVHSQETFSGIDK